MATAMSSGESTIIAPADATMSNVRFQSGIRNNRISLPGRRSGDLGVKAMSVMNCAVRWKSSALMSPVTALLTPAFR